jgi:hypothetical protein
LRKYVAGIEMLDTFEEILNVVRGAVSKKCDACLMPKPGMFGKTVKRLTVNSEPILMAIYEIVHYAKLNGGFRILPERP